MWISSFERHNVKFNRHIFAFFNFYLLLWHHTFAALFCFHANVRMRQSRLLVFVRSAAVGLNAALIPCDAAVWPHNETSIRGRSKAETVTGCYSLWMGEIWKGNVHDNRTRANHALPFNETAAQSCLLFRPTGGVWITSSTDTETQSRGVCQPKNYKLCNMNWSTSSWAVQWLRQDSAAPAASSCTKRLRGKETLLLIYEHRFEVRESAAFLNL